MAEKKGLPSDFDINLPRSNDRPVNIGDYLDNEARPSPAPRLAPKPKPEVSNVVELPKVQPAADEPPAERVVPAEEKRLGLESAGSKAQKQRSSKRKPPKKKGPARKQINATPETLNMLEDLIEHVRTYSEQRDAKASEVFHGLVLALYEAKEFIDLSDVPLRGRWGTPTAKSTLR